MNNYLRIIFILFSLVSTSHASIYIGGNYGLSSYLNPDLEDYKIVPKGKTYGAFLGYGQNYLGLEFIFQKISSIGQINHDGAKHEVSANTTVFGGAVRLSFEYLYMRGGIGSYQIEKNIDIDDEDSLASAQDIYNIRNDTEREAGFLYGAGIQKKFGGVWFFLDYTKYQINSQGSYNTFSGGLSFIIPDKVFKSAF